MKNRDIHLDILKLTVNALGELADDLVFIGGSPISLYITEEGRLYLLALSKLATKASTTSIEIF